jgi:hypothetical protein
MTIQEIDKALSLMRCEQKYKDAMRKRALAGDGYAIFALRHTLHWDGKDKMAAIKKSLGLA